MGRVHNFFCSCQLLQLGPTLHQGKDHRTSITRVTCYLRSRTQHTWMSMCTKRVEIAGNRVLKVMYNIEERQLFQVPILHRALLVPRQRRIGTRKRNARVVLTTETMRSPFAIAEAEGVAMPKCRSGKELNLLMLH
jgi:hypothetical protein